MASADVETASTMSPSASRFSQAARPPSPPRSSPLFNLEQSRSDQSHPAADLFDILVAQGTAKMGFRLLKDYLEDFVKRLQEEDIPEALRDLRASWETTDRTLDWVAIVRAYDREMLTPGYRLQTVKAVVNAARELDLTPKQVRWEIQQYADKRTGCYSTIQELASNGEFAKLAEKCIRDRIAIQHCSAKETNSDIPSLLTLAIDTIDEHQQGYFDFAHLDEYGRLQFRVNEEIQTLWHNCKMEDYAAPEKARLEREKELEEEKLEAAMRTEGLRALAMVADPEEVVDGDEMVEQMLKWGRAYEYSYTIPRAPFPVNAWSALQSKIVERVKRHKVEAERARLEKARREEWDRVVWGGVTMASEVHEGVVPNQIPNQVW